MTSFFGSIINLAINRYILWKLNLVADYTCVLGDDIDLGFNRLVDT